VLTTALLFVLAQAPLKLAAPSFSAVNVPPTTANFLLQSLSERLSSKGISVLTAREIEQVIGLERQRQLLGCSDDAATCASEMGGALGVDGIIVGDLARLGAKYELTLKVIRGRDGQRIAGATRSADAEDQLPDLVKHIADDLADQLLATNGSAPRAHGFHPGPRVWLPVALGGACELGAVIAFAVAATAHASLLSPDTTQTLSFEAATATRDRLGLSQTLGWVGAAVGAAFVVLGVLLGFLTNAEHAG
jgi:hypothetical protein